MSRYLNWSFDYISQHASGARFDEKLYSILESSGENPSGQKYAVLANFRFNHKNPTILKTKDIEIGEINIDKKPENNRVQYDVHYFDVSSGENCSLKYFCRDDICGSIQGEWSISDKNVSSEALPYICRGKLVENSSKINIVLEHETGRSFSAGSIESGTPVVCNYTLFETLPKMIENKISRFAMLEGMERLYPNQHIGYFAEDTLNLNGRNQKIRGYYSYGTGVPPCYWWIGENGKVLIMTTTLLTYVLKN